MPEPEDADPVLSSPAATAPLEPLPFRPGLVWPAPESRAEQDPAVRRRLWVQVAVVLAVAALPDLAYSLIAYSQRDTQYAALAAAGYSPGFFETAVQLIVRSISVVAVVLYVVSTSHEPASGFGIVKPKWLDLPMALGVFVAAMVVSYLFYYGIWIGSWVLGATHAMGLQSEAALDRSEAVTDTILGRPGTRLDYMLLLVMSGANGFAEEIVVCGCLVSRFRRLLGSAPQAVAVAALVFASYHTYQGLTAAVMIFGSGLVTTSTFAMTRRIWPCVIAHACMDVVGYVRLW